MIDLIAAIFCATSIGAGVYYLRYNRMVDLLRDIEGQRRSRLRHRTRRLGSIAMIALGVTLFWGIWELKGGKPTLQLIVAWLAVLMLLILLLLLVCIDMLLTQRMRSQLRRGIESRQSSPDFDDSNNSTPTTRP